MGTIYRKGKVWYASVYDAQGRRSVTSTKCRDKRAAEFVLARLERESADPRHKAANSTTLGSAFDGLIRDRLARGKAAGTINMYRTKAGHWIRILGDIQLSALTAKRVDEVIDARLTEGAARNTIGKELTTLRAALKLAKRRGELVLDVDAIMPIGWSVEYRPRERHLKDAVELQAIINQLLPDRGAHVCFIVATGCRYSESLRARGADVALDVASVRVRGTKTKQSDKRIPIIGWMRPLLEYVLTVCHGSGGPLFRPWGNIGRELPAAAARAGLEHVTANDLRRTHATWLREQGASPHLIAGMLRHADSRMVERVYGRMPADALGPALEAQLRPVEGFEIRPTTRVVH